MKFDFKKFAGAASFMGAFGMFVACGENTTTETIVEKGGMDIVSSVSELPKCTSENEGEQVIVKEDGGMRLCSDGKWYAVSSNASAQVPSCSTAELADGTGIKILCNGDSVGVVLNGKDGAQGIQGEKGDTGATGAAGKDGADGKDGGVAAGCTVETLADNSGLKVICGGDSVGVVLNGVDGKDGAQGVQGEQGIQGEKGETGATGPAGADGKDGVNGTDGKDGVDGKDGKDGVGGDGSSCALVTKDCIVHVACDKDTVSLDVISSDDACHEVAVLDSEMIAVSLDSVKGASQKGPFLSGSKVLVKELRDGRSLTQTGNNFDGKILNDKGEFKITARMLVSQYVMLEANGYYRNEVTGENSNSTLTLFGITDVTLRNIVNINLLTHLEYERVQYLVTQKKMTVKKAKAQAQKEILGILHIDNTNFSNSEDLSIAGSSDEDGALLAFSILFQGDRTVAELSELLTKVSTGIETTGVWDDAATKLAIADWAMAADTSGRMNTIRNYVTAWGLSAKVANFEPYVRNFWRAEYGLGDCSNADSVALGTVVKPAKGNAKLDVRFICGVVNGERQWHTASDIEKDTYGWKAGTDGDKKNGDVTNTVYVYDADGVQTAGKVAGWRKAIGPEEEFGGCRAELYGNIVTYRGKTDAGFYQCLETTHKWVKTLNTLTIDTQKWKPETDGYAAWGDSIGVISKVGTDINWNKVCYVYDESLSPAAYRKGQNTDCSLGLMGCTKKRAGEYLTAENGGYYTCSAEKWNEIVDPVLRNTHGLACKADSNNAEMIHGTMDDVYFVCSDNKWEQASLNDEIACRNEGLCAACLANGTGKFDSNEQGVVFGCTIDGWLKTTLPLSVMGARCTGENLDTAIYNLDTLAVNGSVANTTDWLCSSAGWRRANDWRDYSVKQWWGRIESLFGLDTSETSTTFFRDERDGSWYRKVTVGDQVWMAENLRYADSAVSVNLKGNSWCYNNDSQKCLTGGRYYSWTAAMDFNGQWQKATASALIKSPHRGICPEGWHIPTVVEWRTLGVYSGGYIAQQMTGSVYVPNATNASGFSALIGGYYNGYVMGVSSRTNFWSATENGTNDASYWYMTASYGNVIDGPKSLGFPVRCVQD